MHVALSHELLVERTRARLLVKLKIVNSTGGVLTALHDERASSAASLLCYCPCVTRSPRRRAPFIRPPSPTPMMDFPTPITKVGCNIS